MKPFTPTNKTSKNRTRGFTPHIPSTSHTNTNTNTNTNTKPEPFYYCYDFKCTYKQHNDDITDDMYRNQLLQAFYLDEWEDTVVQKTTAQIYEDIKIDFKELFEHLKTSSTSMIWVSMLSLGQSHQENKNETKNETKNTDIHDDDEINLHLFSLFFGYDLFDLTHDCLCEKYKNGHISPSALIKLQLEMKKL
jgi:hypothetical protein